MAIIQSYPLGTPKLTDTIIGVEYKENEQPATKSFTINDIVELVPTVDPIGRPYKVYTALLTQSGGDTEVDLNAGDDILKGITYYINVNDNNGNFTQYGAPNNNVGTYFVCNQNGVVPEGAQVYYNEGAPVVTVLENTIGNIWWTYHETGVYNINSIGLFTQNKTVVFIQNTTDDGNNSSTNLGYSGTLPDNIQIITATQSEGLWSNNNGVLYNTPIEIRVYN